MALSCGARTAFKPEAQDYLRSVLSRRQLQGIVMRRVSIARCGALTRLRPLGRRLANEHGGKYQTHCCKRRDQPHMLPVPPSVKKVPIIRRKRSRIPSRNSRVNRDVHEDRDQRREQTQPTGGNQQIERRTVTPEKNAEMPASTIPPMPVTAIGRAIPRSSA